jgi:hypothetical protein
MELTHALTGAVYVRQDDGLVKVTETDGRVGYFRADGTHVSGELRFADPHMIDWLGMPQAKSAMGRMAAALGQTTDDD